MATTDTQDRASGGETQGASASTGSGQQRRGGNAAIGGLKGRTAEAYQAARERAGSAYDDARQRASRAGRRTAEGIDANPIAALAGGLALGALVAALFPKTEREERLLGNTGRKITNSAREATRAARESGREQLAGLGLTREGAREKIQALAGAVGGAKSSSAKSGKSKKKQ